MDNLIQNTEPIEAAGATAATQDNSSAPETQPSETPEVVSANDGQTEGSTQNPWDADPRFKGKTADEMFNIVQEADKYKGQLSQKAKALELLESETGLSAEEIAGRLEAEQRDRQEQLITENPGAYALQELQRMQSQMAFNEVQNEMNSFIQANPEYSDFQEEILKLGLTVEQDKSFDEIAKSYFGRAIAKGQESAYKKIETKTQSQVTPSSSQDKRSITIDDMRNMSSEELRAILKK